MDVVRARVCMQIGGFFGLLAVVIGAFGAHAMKARLDSTGLRSVFETGVHFQMFHALAILLLASIPSTVVSSQKSDRIVTLFTTGIILFSGSLYALALTDVRILGAITPLGGLCFIIGWLMLIAAARKGET